MTLPSTADTSRPWRIHEIAPDVRVEDVWARPTPGGPGELPRLVSASMSSSFPERAPLVVRALWELRWKIGRLLGWDGPDTGVGARVASLRDRLPAAPTGPDFTDVPMTSVGPLDDEWAAEIANRTVHSVMHIGWVATRPAATAARMAVLTKPNGWFGATYTAAIRPFRYLLGYPALMRWIERAWRADAPSAAWAGAPA